MFGWVLSEPGILGISGDGVGLGGGLWVRWLVMGVLVFGWVLSEPGILGISGDGVGLGGGPWIGWLAVWRCCLGGLPRPLAAHFWFPACAGMTVGVSKKGTFFWEATSL